MAALASVLQSILIPAGHMTGHLGRVAHVLAIVESPRSTAALTVASIMAMVN